MSVQVTLRKYLTCFPSKLGLLQLSYRNGPSIIQFFEVSSPPQCSGSKSAGHHFIWGLQCFFKVIGPHAWQEVSFCAWPTWDLMNDPWISLPHHQWAWIGWSRLCKPCSGLVGGEGWGEESSAFSSWKKTFRQLSTTVLALSGEAGRKCSMCLQSLCQRSIAPVISMWPIA